jgi:hypothetical protein
VLDSGFPQTQSQVWIVADVGFRPRRAGKLVVTFRIARKIHGPAISKPIGQTKRMSCADLRDRLVLGRLPTDSFQINQSAELPSLGSPMPQGTGE